MPDIPPPEVNRNIADNPWANRERTAKEIREKARPVDYSEVVGDNRIVFLAENHSNRAIRSHLARHAGNLKAAGITHYTIEASDKGKETFDRLSRGEDVDLSRVDVGPGRNDYEDVIYAMHAAGIRVVPIDIDQKQKPTKEQREAHIAANIEKIIEDDPTAKVAVLIGAFHTSRHYVSEGVPSVGKRFMDKGIPATNVHFAGGQVAVPLTITQGAQGAGMANREFMLDMRPYQDTEHVPYGKGESDYLIHLPQAPSSDFIERDFGNPQFFDVDLSSLKF